MTVAGERGPLTAARVAQEPGVRQILDRVREHLQMDIAFLTGLTHSAEVVLATSSETGPMQMAVGDERDLDDTYCVRVLRGLLPPVVPDALRHPEVRDLDVTHELGVGAYIGAPLRGPDGEPVGMLCCLAQGSRPLLGEDGLRVLGLAAALVEDQLGVPGLPYRPAESDRVRGIRAVLAARDVRTVFQRVEHLASGTVVAVEALSRFDPARFPTPVHAFAAASAAGCSVDLELLAARLALRQVPRLPDDVRLSVNLSAEALVDPRTAELLVPCGRHVGVELTEHTPVEDYGALLQVTERLRDAGLQVVVDDAGAGYASLRHVLRLRPTAIKLDLDLVRDVDADPVRQSLARAVVDFAASIGAWLVAEGIETEAERETLMGLGVQFGQGYLLGRPGTWGDALGAGPFHRL